jgi:hypothetical protein
MQRYTSEPNLCAGALRRTKGKDSSPANYYGPIPRYLISNYSEPCTTKKLLARTAGYAVITACKETPTQLLRPLYKGKFCTQLLCPP